ncbi:hypothetical protein K5E_22070 [Enterococcus thailandicus]|nr:hypothetical protein K4E_00520 [Enterococcus thailandicus]GMC10068.1 hypothetical protein K5E_22070 [Enterococcus thailandicus]
MVMDLTKNQPKEQQAAMSFEKTEAIAILNRNAKGWTIELNKVSYNGREPVYDLRSWSPDGRMGKGLTLTDQTVENLLIVLNTYLKEDKPVVNEEAVETEDIPAHIPSDFQ